MSECGVVGCEHQAEITAGWPTPSGAWEYWVCLDHKARIDDGAVIHDNPDGRTITVDRLRPHGQAGLDRWDARRSLRLIHDR